MKNEVKNANEPVFHIKNSNLRLPAGFSPAFFTFFTDLAFSADARRHRYRLRRSEKQARKKTSPFQYSVVVHSFHNGNDGNDAKSIVTGIVTAFI
ncbi:hypothetical protein [Paracoccus ravus]|uniref:hypothetical protein n=1 Tax=Paracoccus ravus TaxID=2447760 RepID=UPI00106E5FB3|nr:hypothetical protein [Paracoccus ravus]